jgi:hypothetical protein
MFNEDNIRNARIAYKFDTPHDLLKKTDLSEDERATLLKEYRTRGMALALKGDRGIIDSHARREGNFGQFFTPQSVTKIMAQAVGICNHPAWGDKWEEPTNEGSIVDLSGCGNGRMFEFAPKSWHKSGIEIDPLAARAARLIYPEAEIIEADLISLNPPPIPKYYSNWERPYTVAMINPPFSIQLRSQARLDLIDAKWGIWGQATSIASHWAALEMAIRMAYTVVAVLPTTALEGENEKAFNKIREKTNYVMRLDLPTNTFKSEGTEWPCSVIILTSDHISRKTYEPETWEEAESCIAGWVENNIKEYQSYRASHRVPAMFAFNRQHCGKPELSSFIKTTTEITKSRKMPQGNETDLPTIRMCVSGRSNKIILKPNNAYAMMALEVTRLYEGWISSPGFKPQSRLNWACDLTRNAGSATAKINEVAHALTKYVDLNVTIDEQLMNYAAKADRKTTIELTPHSQWIKKGDEWEKRDVDDIDIEDHPAKDAIASRHGTNTKLANMLKEGLTIKKWDRRIQKHVEHTYPPLTLYDFTVNDIVRTLGRKSVIYSAKQGLGKTRYSVGTLLASGATRGLWILESRLVEEFKRELSKIGMLQHFKLIEKKKDLKDLRLINVITYSRLWKSVSHRSKDEDKPWGPAGSFAAILAKRRMTIIIDEAHKIKSATSKQAIAARYLCQKAKRVILMTGTAIQSYPRNILGLIAAGWGDGSSMNPYGYRRPVEGLYSPEGPGRDREALIKGVTNFVDKFCDVMWYTPQFAQTASTGQKSREIPRLRNPPLWNSFVHPKIIRRVPAEPEVRASGFKTPEAKPIYIPVDPKKDHFAYYHLVLAKFAEIWEELLNKNETVSNIAHILPMLNALRFASTAPFVKHEWNALYPTLKEGYHEPTALIEKALTLINGWVENGDKVVVGAHTPAALKYLADMLSEINKYIPDAEPINPQLALDSNIASRNKAINAARDTDLFPVLLISVGMGKEGLNLPEFSRLLTLDLGWVPGDLDQFRHRILRPGQSSDVEIVHLYHQGMIDSYMRQLNEAKMDGISQAIDGQISTFDYDEWADYKTFTLRMLEQEGYAFASEALAKMQDQIH